MITDRPFYLQWRLEKKESVQLYLRMPHLAALQDYRDDLRKRMRKTLLLPNAPLTISNVIELLTEETLWGKNEKLDNHIRKNGRMINLIKGDF